MKIGDVVYLGHNPEKWYTIAEVKDSIASCISGVGDHTLSKRDILSCYIVKIPVETLKAVPDELVSERLTGFVNKLIHISEQNITKV